jgi:hypothetical protein
MRLEISYDKSQEVYNVWDVDDKQSDEPLGVGTSPDEAVGMAVRVAWLASDGGVTVDDIAHEDDSNIGDDLCDRCRRSGVVCYRTDEHGTVCVDCDDDEEDDG